MTKIHCMQCDKCVDLTVSAYCEHCGKCNCDAKPLCNPNPKPWTETIPISGSPEADEAFSVAVKPATQPLFEKRAMASIKRVTDTFGQRGAEYGDTMRDCQWLALRAVAKKLGVNIPAGPVARAIAIAGMVDIKYQRYQGGYKDDNGIDGIAYGAFLADEMQELAG